MDGRGYGPRRGVVSRCGRCDCRRTVKMERIKREDIPWAVVLALAGRPTSRPSCFGRNAPAAAAALSPSLSLFLSLSSASGSSNASHASSLHFNYPVLWRLCTETRLFLSLFICRSIHGQTSYTVTAISIPLFIRLPCYPCVLRLRDSSAPLSSLATSSYRRRSARDAPLFSFLIPLTLALFSLPLHPLLPLCRYKYPAGRYF